MFWFLLILIAAFALFLLYREGLLKDKFTLFIAVCCTAIVFILRAACREYISGDYVSFLDGWVDYFRTNGGFAALSKPIGNYNLPYQYLLALFSYLNIYDLYLIKLLSIFFDVVLAYYSMKIVGRFTENVYLRLASFFIILALPTVIVNGAYWGQCDSIYTAFGLMSIYYAMESKPVKSMIALGMSFAFKLQAVFFMPIFLIFLIMRKIKIRHLFVFPAVYVATTIPAVIAGHSFWQAITFYFSNATSAGSGLNYNSASIFAFKAVRELGNAETMAKVGIAAAFLLVAVILLLLIIRRNRINDNIILLAVTIFATGIPLLLPHMHDRYFFPADVLTAICAIVCLYRLALPILMSFSSLVCYCYFLRRYYILPLNVASTAAIIVLVMLVIELVMSLFRSTSEFSEKLSGEEKIMVDKPD